MNEEELSRSINKRKRFLRLDSRRTTAHHISTSTTSVNIKTMEELERIVKNLLAYIKYICGQNSYDVNILIGISQHRNGCVEFVYESNGNKGRPCRVPKEIADNALTNPHLHIAVLGNPGSTIKDLIVQYLEKLGIECYVKRCRYIINLIIYIVGQGTVIRKLINHEFDVFTFIFRNALAAEEMKNNDGIKQNANLKNNEMVNCKVFA